MRCAELRKMETFIGQVDALLSVNKLKVLGSALQNLTVSEQEELLENDNWKNHCVDDDYSHSTVLSIGEDEDESSNDQQQKQQTVVERQQEEYVIFEFRESESEEEEEEEEQQQQQTKVEKWDSDDSKEDSTKEDEEDYGMVGSDCVGNESDDNKSDNEDIKVDILCYFVYICSRI